MLEESKLQKLKEKYSVLRIKYNLPNFEELNGEFQIEKTAESETDFILKEIRRYMVDKLLNYLRFIESLLSPVNVPMFVFAITKTLGEHEKEKLRELYKKIAKVEVEFIELDLEYSESKEAESIKKYYSFWQEIRKELLIIVGVIKENWDAKAEDNGKGYFG